MVAYHYLSVRLNILSGSKLLKLKGNAIGKCGETLLGSLSVVNVIHKDIEATVCSFMYFCNFRAPYS